MLLMNKKAEKRKVTERRDRGRSEGKGGERKREDYKRKHNYVTLGQSLRFKSLICRMVI